MFNAIISKHLSVINFHDIKWFFSSSTIIIGHSVKKWCMHQHHSIICISIKNLVKTLKQHKPKDMNFTSASNTLRSGMKTTYFHQFLISKLAPQEIKFYLIHRVKLCQEKFSSGKTIRRAKFSSPNKKFVTFTRRKFSSNKRKSIFSWSTNEPKRVASHL